MYFRDESQGEACISLVTFMENVKAILINIRLNYGNSAKNNSVHNYPLEYHCAKILSLFTCIQCCKLLVLMIKLNENK